MEKQKFVLFFGNRSFFPKELISVAQEELKYIVEKLGYEAICLDESILKNGAVETVEDGMKFASFLKDKQGEYDGIILSLPNFGDENGAIVALKDCGTPILIHAYPDEIGKMDFAHRRDAFCGKFSIMNIFYQYKLPYTIFKPHTISPNAEEFEKNIKDFATICRIVKKSKNFTVGAIGARTTAFKTVRFDELTLQRKGITVETIDMSEIFLRIKSIKDNSKALSKRIKDLSNYTDFSNIPESRLFALSKLSLAIDDVISEYKIDCLALRCWPELQKEYGIAPCVLLSELNDRGIVSACELDVCNAVAMYALSSASQEPSACLDWNNNYKDIDDKCILFHCGSTAQTLMKEKGKIVDHKMFAKDLGSDSGWGCNTGIISKGPMTFASTKTENGDLTFYLGEGAFTGENVDKEYFGCYGVVQIDNLQKILLGIGKNGFIHHVSVTRGRYMSVLKEAFNNYLGYKIIEFN